MFKLEFGTDNAAFDDDIEEATISTLQDVAASMRAGYTEGIIRDINGARIGRYELTQAPNVELGQTSSGSCRLTDIVEGIRELLPKELIDEFDLYDENEPDDEATQAGIFEEICDYLDEIAPEGAHFGTSEGDGASYGFWKDAEEGKEE